MSLGLSKRQQVRNERALQELIKSVPGNNVCADCQTKNPGWASWNLGIFLCMRCAGLHRKLGTHISKVKSLSMDSWTSDQVDSMKKHGNIASNKIYNPKNIKPPIPLDVDEVDSAMERFIRQKYEQRILADGKPRPPSRNNTGNTGERSSEDTPPPLPPKTGKRFGFTLRAHSAQYPAKTPGLAPPPVRVDVSKPTRIYSTASDDSYESKLATLREMGFPDDKRNSTVLKGLSGDLERTIESLVRLGEGSRPSSRNPTPSVTPRSGDFDHAEIEKPPKPVSKSTNPFDVPAPAATQQQSIGLSFGQPELPPSQPPQPTNLPVSYNPFDVPPHPTQSYALDQAFQSMQVSQPLFPNSTGGYPSQQQQLQQARYQQSMTPPVPFLPQQYSFVSTPPLMTANSNPFFQAPAPQPQPQSPSTNPFFPQPQYPQQSNPFFSRLPSLNAQVQSQPQLQSDTQSPTIAQPQPPSHFASQPHAFAQSSMPPPQLQHSATLPIQQSNAAETFFQPQMQPHQQPTHSAQQPQAQQPFKAPPQFQQQQQYPPQPILSQQTGRIDKSSILALYNFPQLAPRPVPTSTGDASSTNLPSINGQPLPPQFQPNVQPPQRSVTMPVTPSSSSPGVTNTAATASGVFGSSSMTPSPMPSAPFSAAGSRNPFLRTGKIDPIMEQPEIGRHMSRESVNLQGLQEGRHSPDAFASLSARFLR